MKICGGNMDRAIRLIVIGIMPLILGFVLNWLLMILPITGFFILLLSLLFLIVWGYAAFKIASPSRNFILQAFLMCIFGLQAVLAVLRNNINDLASLFRTPELPKNPASGSRMSTGQAMFQMLIPSIAFLAAAYVVHYDYFVKLLRNTL